MVPGWIKDSGVVLGEDTLCRWNWRAWGADRSWSSAIRSHGAVQHDPGPFSLRRKTFLQAVDLYPGLSLLRTATHIHFFPTDRSLTDEMIGKIARRGGLSGSCLTTIHDGGLESRVSRLSITQYADVIDYIVQQTGSVGHVAIAQIRRRFRQGIDPPGDGFGGDLIKIADNLQRKGYGKDDIQAILHGKLATHLAGQPAGSLKHTGNIQANHKDC